MNLVLAAIHWTYIIFIVIFILFINDIRYLFLVAAIVLITLITNYVYGDCPISLIEDKYGRPGAMDIFMMATCGDKCPPEMRSLITLEFIWIGLILLGCKIMFISILYLFKPTVKNLLKIIS